MARDLTTAYRIPNFIKGINESVDSNLLGANEAKNAQNCNIGEGNLKRANGCTSFANALGSPIKTLMPYFKNGVCTLLIAAGGKIYKYEGGTYTELKTGFTSDNFDYLNFRIDLTDVIIFGNGVNNTQVYDGVTFEDLKHDGKDSVASPTNKAPKASMMALHYERVWAAGDLTNPDRVYFSSATRDGFDPHDWTYPITEGEANMHGGFIDIPTWDSSKIIGLSVIFDDVLVFKNKQVFKIFGSDPSNYTKIQLFSSNGAIADKSIVSAKNSAYFLNKDGIYRYDGANVQLISLPIKNFIKTINKDYIQNSVAYFYDNKYILAVPEGSSNVNNAIIEYNTETGSYMIIRGIEVTSFAEYLDKLIFTNATGKLFNYNEGNTFDGANITAYWQSGLTDLDTPEGLKTIESIYLTGSGSGDVKITLSTEVSSKSITVTLTNDVKAMKLNLRNKGRIFSIKIENVNGSYFDIHSIKVLLELDID